jgi:hypothetical protein
MSDGPILRVFSQSATSPLLQIISISAAPDSCRIAKIPRRLSGAEFPNRPLEKLSKQNFLPDLSFIEKYFYNYDRHRLADVEIRR